MLKSIALLATIASTAAPRWARFAAGTSDIVPSPIVVPGVAEAMSVFLDLVPKCGPAQSRAYEQPLLSSIA